jgi:hypothetical protein
VLIFNKNGKGFVHDNIAAATKALQEITAAAGIESEVSTDPALFTDDSLKRFKAVIFNNTNNETVDTPPRRPRSSATSGPAAASSASIPPPGPSASGPGSGS